MIHEPRGLLGYIDDPSDLIRADAVLAVGNEPHRTEPLLERDRAVFEDRTDLDGELFPAFEAGPHHPRLDKRQALVAALWAFWTLRAPLRLLGSLKAHPRVRKVLDCALQPFWNLGVNVAHE